MSNLGDSKTKKLTSGRFFFKPKGDASHIDFGNVLTHKPSWSVGRADHMKSENGVKRVDISLIKEINPKYEFELDEHVPELNKLKSLGTQGADVVQAATNVVAEVLCNANSAQGRTFFTANVGLSAVVVKVAAVVQTLDTDYALDAGSGAITILNDGGIVDGSTVTVDYTCAAVTTQPFTAFQTLEVEGDCIYQEKDQFSLVPRETTTFYGQIYVSNWGDNNLGDFNKVTLVAVPLDDPIISTRKD